MRARRKVVIRFRQVVATTLVVLAVLAFWSILNDASPDQVLFDMLQTADGGLGTGVTQSGSANGQGIILALDRDFTMMGNPFTGRLFSDTVETIPLFSELTINQATTQAPVPEPASILLLGSGLVGLAYCRRRRCLCASR
jgi:hypothetical protein